jgi:hypothetical protein
MLSNDRGTAAVLTAASMILFMGLAALAIDLGAGFAEDRVDQTAADLGVVAGALQYISPDVLGTATQQVLDFVEDNLPNTYSAAEWEAMWTACTDPSKPAGFNPLPAPAAWTAATIDCISGSTDELRVRVPDQIVQTTFGRVIGFDQLSTWAVAQAQVRFRSGGGIRPFGLLDGLAAGTQCLSTSPGGLAWPPCDGPSSGNFGAINSQTWGNDDIGSLIDCGLPGNDELAQNIALGVDHLIGLAPAEPIYGAVYNGVVDATARLDDCQDIGGVAFPTDNTPSFGPVNTLRIDTGFNLKAATKIGFIAGQPADFPNASPAPTPLLQQTSGAGVFSTRLIWEKLTGAPVSYRVDNTPLSNHLRPVAALAADGMGAPLLALCNKVLIEAAPDVSAAMSACLAAYETELLVDPNLTHLFEDTIGENPRFTWVPQFHYSVYGSGNHWQPVKTYRMVYLDIIWFNCNGNYNQNQDNDEPCTGTKGLVFVPEGTVDESDLQVGNGNAMKTLRLDQISSFLLPGQAVPEEIAANFPGNIRGPFEIQITR